MVIELSHYLELPEETPGPARPLAADLYGIVRAATAGDAGTAWTSALPCRRRPAHRPCNGRLVVLRPGPPAPIHWECSVCGDEGLISGWEDSPFDLRRRGLTLTGAVNEVLLPAAVTATLRELQLLDIDCERLVYRIRVDGDTRTATRPGGRSPRRSPAPSPRAPSPTRVARPMRLAGLGGRASTINAAEHRPDPAIPRRPRGRLWAQDADLDHAHSGRCVAPSRRAQSGEVTRAHRSVRTAQTVSSNERSSACEDTCGLVTERTTLGMCDRSPQRCPCLSDPHMQKDECGARAALPGS